MTDSELSLLRDRDWLIEKLREITDQKRIAPARKLAFDALAGHGYVEWAKTWKPPSGQQAA